jgi:hypothetical protein
MSDGEVLQKPAGTSIPPPNSAAILIMAHLCSRSPARDGPSLSRKRRIQKPEFSIQNWNPLTGNVYYYSDS